MAVVRGFIADANKAIKDLEKEVGLLWVEKKLRVDECEVPPETLLRDLQAAVAGRGASVTLAPCGRFVVLRALGKAALDGAHLDCLEAEKETLKSARAIPVDWDPSISPALGKSFARIDVTASSPEWTNVTAAVAATLPAAKIEKIERVQNLKLWAAYTQRRHEIASESACGFDANEKWCFHGSSAFPVDSVCDRGLDFRHGNTASYWGTALYLAVNASYSSAYSSDGGDDLRQIFYVRAALGRIAEVPQSSSIRAPPLGHDSVQGVTQGCRVHMLYDLGQAYPEYIITYR